MSKPPKKFREGPEITSMAELEECLERVGYVFIFGERPQHKTFVYNLSWQTLRGGMRSGRLKRALITDEWALWKEAQGGSDQ